MARTRPRNVIKLGDHLVTTESGDTVYASEVAVGLYGAQKGLLVHRDDLDSPGRFDLPRRTRSERPVEPRTGEVKQTWIVYDGDGAVVSGGPADS